MTPDEKAEALRAYVLGLMRMPQQSTSLETVMQKAYTLLELERRALTLPIALSGEFTDIRGGQ